ncbi:MULTISPECIES: PEP-CTERM sorting domain-containing protein [unclassified Roseateles]|uniref:PEP-CTERM sorting domain-containing protein n=1 Tax=unclassified Roseateles TaxID=2626991 RepID=UPI0006F5A74A|nr:MULTISPECIES: PEP-CTERM sorting domain-containing protein [unclassified Roseateles]KQW42467.1 hypothetical protein ASC81_21715 [Pelomonas sp. Root405]KRA68341.1 hypothetical protein ASD88_23300 [Pelomonas sp. Root662]
MKSSLVLAGVALAAGLAAGTAQAQALPIVDGFTSVRLDAAPTLTGAGVTVGLLGSALFSPGSNGIPLVYFPVTGGAIDTATFAGSIEHAGSGLSLTRAGTTVNLSDFVIDTVGGQLTGQVNIGATTLSNVSLFSIGLTGSPAAPFSLSLTATAAGALTSALGLPDLTGVQVGSASTLPITAAVPEPATYAAMLGGLGLLGLVTRRRAKANAAPALA